MKKKKVCNLTLLRIKALLGIVCMLLIFGENNIVYAYESDGYCWNSNSLYKEISELVGTPSPITNIENGGKKATYRYDDLLRRVEKNIDGVQTQYYYEDGKLTEEHGKHHLYFLYNDKKCDTILFEEKKFFLIYDEIGNVDSIVNEFGETLCHYMYENTLPIVYEIVDKKEKINTEVDFIGNINPFRYQGWYWDAENACYYLGDGIFYDSVRCEFITNAFEIQKSSLRTPAIVTNVLNRYSVCLSSAGYGATVYADDYISASQWAAGQRWFDGIEQTELIARCIYAENNGGTGTNGNNDRAAEALLIMNRVNSTDFPYDTSPYVAVTRLSQFSTINPNGYAASISQTRNARQIGSRTSDAWKEATLMACILYYTTSTSDFTYFHSIPNYISTQTMMLSVNYVYDNMVFQAVNNVWMYQGNRIRKVSIAGGEELSPVGNPSIRSLLYAYYLQGYNIFYEYY